jgi:fructokinase
VALFGGIEAGGTKFVCAVGTGPDDLRATARFPTTTPDETIAQAIAFFRQQPEPVDAIGIGREFGVPIGFDTDVNGAALGERRWGAAQGVDTALYITVGTGIGGGVIVGGKPLHGALHPEIGHILIPHDRQADPFGGTCPFHGDCLEGLAAGPAVGARWGQRAETLPSDHPAWPLEAHYLALGLVACIYSISPERIILGGGIMQQPHMFPLIHAEVRRLLNGYLKIPAILEQIETYIVPPGLGSDAGVLGAIALAEDAFGAR